MKRNILAVFAAILIMGCVNTDKPAFSNVVREGGSTFIVDRQGQRWDVTQAESIGFKPQGFQYGMGRDYFSPLDDSNISSSTKDTPGDLRVIGIHAGQEARAYSVTRLRSHEVSNSTIGGKPIAVGY